MIDEKYNKIQEAIERLKQDRSSKEKKSIN